MGLLNAMAALAEEWDDILSHLDTDQAARLRGTGHPVRGRERSRCLIGNLPKPS